MNRNFTGQTQDTTAGLYDFLFRQQSSAQGRWLVPDPASLAALDLTNPQTWNRYAYVGNNPLNAVDPKGLERCKDPPDYSGNCDGGAGGVGGGGGEGGGGLLGNNAAAAEASYLSSGTIPWYNVVNGNLMLLIGSNFQFTPNPSFQGDLYSNAGTGVKTSIWTDLGPLITQAGYPSLGFGWADLVASGAGDGGGGSGVYSTPGQSPVSSNRSNGPVRVTPQQASNLCWAAVQLRNNGVGPLSGFSGDPIYSVGQSANIFGPRLLNPSAANAGMTTQSAASGFAMVVGKNADYQTCMAVYASNQY